MLRSTMTRTVAVAAALLAGTLGAGGVASAAESSAPGVHTQGFCGNWYKLTSNHTLYRTASTTIPAGSVPSGRVVPDMGRSNHRVYIGDGYIADINMKIVIQGTCPA